MNNSLKIRHFILFILILICAGCASANKQWQKAQITNTIESYERFIAAYPENELVGEAKQKVLVLAWKKATKANTVEAYEDFLARFAKESGSPLNEEAKLKIEALKIDAAWNKATELNSIRSYKEFLDAYPDKEPFSNDAKARLHKFEFDGLMKSAVSNDVSSLKRVLDDGRIDVNIKDSEGYTALHKACQAGAVESAALLLQKGADVNAFVYNNQVSSGHKVTCDRRTGVVKHDLGIGATPLLLACEKGSVPLVELLIKYKANVNLPGKEGLEYATPLCTAIIMGQTNIVHLLIKHKADVNQKGAKVLIEDSRMGKITMGLISPLALSNRLGNKHKNIRQMLLQAGAK